jgi:glycosyltransferase involved in cell wall biosynthesis
MGDLMQQANTGTAAEATPLVSVAITSYNHAKFISKAIESVLAQRTSFSFEIAFGDDCSTDDTVAVMRSYQEKYPDIIRIFDRTKNVGTQRNYFDLFERCRGKYIAWLDADDYWTDPEKLSIQVQVLEDDPTLSLCAHFVQWVTRDGKLIRASYPELAPGRHGTRAILTKNFIPSPAAMFRNGLQRKLPQWYFDVPPLTDWPLWVFGSLEGDIYIIDRVMADYTLNSTSQFWGKGDYFWRKMNADFYDRVESELPPQLQEFARLRKSQEYREMAYILRQEGKFVESRQAAVQAFLATSPMVDIGQKAKSLAVSLVREVHWRLKGSPRIPKSD